MRVPSGCAQFVADHAIEALQSGGMAMMVGVYPDTNISTVISIQTAHRSAAGAPR